jgi:hypothetical protein
VETTKADMERILQFRTPMSQENATMYGFSVYGQDSLLLLDRSLLIPDALFLRIERRHPPDRPINAVAESVFADQSGATAALGVTFA